MLVPFRAVLGLAWVIFYWYGVISLISTYNNLLVKIGIGLFSLIVHIKIMRFINQWDKGGKYFRA